MKIVAHISPRRRPHRGVCSLHGQLEKQRRLKTWRWSPYWFFLEGDQLAYFKDEKRQKSRGLIDMAQAQCVRVTPSYISHGFPFEIVTGSRSHVLSAASAHARESWIRALNQAMCLSLRRSKTMQRPRCDSISEGELDEDEVKKQQAHNGTAGVPSVPPFRLRIQSDLSKCAEGVSKLAVLATQPRVSFDLSNCAKDESSPPQIHSERQNIPQYASTLVNHGAASSGRPARQGRAPVVGRPLTSTFAATPADMPKCVSFSEQKLQSNLSQSAQDLLRLALPPSRMRVHSDLSRSSRDMAKHIAQPLRQQIQSHLPESVRPTKDMPKWAVPYSRQRIHSDPQNSVLDVLEKPDAVDESIGKLMNYSPPATNPVSQCKYTFSSSKSAISNQSCNLVSSVICYESTNNHVSYNLSPSLNNAGSPSNVCCEKLPCGNTLYDSSNLSRVSLPHGENICESSSASCNASPCGDKECEYLNVSCIPFPGDIARGSKCMAPAAAWDTHLEPQASHNSSSLSCNLCSSRSTAIDVSIVSSNSAHIGIKSSEVCSSTKPLMDLSTDTLHPVPSYTSAGPVSLNVWPPQSFGGYTFRVTDSTAISMSPSPSTTLASSSILQNVIAAEQSVADLRTLLTSCAFHNNSPQDCRCSQTLLSTSAPALTAVTSTVPSSSTSFSLSSTSSSTLPLSSNNTNNKSLSVTSSPAPIVIVTTNPNNNTSLVSAPSAPRNMPSSPNISSSIFSTPSAPSSTSSSTSALGSIHSEACLKPQIPSCPRKASDLMPSSEACSKPHKPSRARKHAALQKAATTSAVAQLGNYVIDAVMANPILPLSCDIPGRVLQMDRNQSSPPVDSRESMTQMSSTSDQREHTIKLYENELSKHVQVSQSSEYDGLESQPIPWTCPKSAHVPHSRLQLVLYPSFEV